MTVDLIIHGVPNGQDMWGVNDDTHYFSTFYVQKDEKEILTIETRKISGKSYTCYNYLKYNCVTAFDGRAGAYLGITLRFDAYYKNVLNIYHLCEIVYNNLTDIILVKNGDNVKFKIAKFEDADRELNEIKRKMINLINLSATAKDFISINDSFFNNEGLVIKAFLLDCTPDNVMQALSRYGKVEISKYYPSVNETKKLKGVEERFKATISQKDKDLHNANSENEELKKVKKDLVAQLESKEVEISELRKRVSEKDETIKKNEEEIKTVSTLKTKNENLRHDLQEKNQEVDRLKSELNQYKKDGNLSDLVKEIKVPLSKLAEVAGRQLATFPDNSNAHIEENCYNTDAERKKKREKVFWETPLWQVSKIILIVLVFCTSLFCAYKLCLYPDNQVKVEQTDKTSFIEETIEPKTETATGKNVCYQEDDKNACD